MRAFVGFAFVLLLVVNAGSQTKSAVTQFPTAAQLGEMAARFAPTPLRVDVSALSPGDRQALPKLIEAARILDDIFLDQLWSGNRALYQRLQADASELGRARLHFFWLNKGPWDELGDYKAFLPGVPARKPLGANFYPEDLTKREFEKALADPAKKPAGSGAWCFEQPSPSPQTLMLTCGGTLSKEDLTGFFTVVRRAKWYTSPSPVSSVLKPSATAGLAALPYSQIYRPDLERAAALLKEAAALTDNASLRRFLNLRAEAFLSNDYYPSDLAWMDLDASIDPTIGPYETYNDELFGYKAAFEAYINLRDDRETAKLAAFSRHLQEIEDHLPEAPEYRNPRLGAAAPIRVVNEILSAGDGAHGVQGAAYNLPNDERVVKEKGSKRVMLRNVQEAKFRSVLVPIAARVLQKKELPDLSFEMFFTHILAHELMHGLGPHQITLSGRKSTPHLELKELYGVIEEAKADVAGLFALQYMFDHATAMNLAGVLPTDDAAERQLYITYLASAFRSLRFGLNDAHGKGMAVQFNYFIDKGAFIEHSDGSFAVNLAKMKAAVRDLTRELLTLEAMGDYAGARHMINTLGVIRPATKRALDHLQGVPTDIEPQFITADQLTGKYPAVVVPPPPPPPPKAKKPARKPRRR